MWSWFFGYIIFSFGPIYEITSDVIVMQTTLIKNNRKYLNTNSRIEMLSVEFLPFRHLQIYWLIYTFSLEANINDVVVIVKHGYNNSKQKNTPFNSYSVYK